MRLIDADPIVKNLSAMKTQLGYDAIDIDGMIKALREAEEVEAQSLPPNDPLTLEQTLEMDGEPVWDNSGNCFIVRINVHGTDGYGADKFATYTKLDILCKRGLYRRKPEEGTNAS